MNKNKKPLSMKVLALGGVALVGAGVLVGAFMFPKEVVQVQIEEQIKLQNVTVDLTQEQADIAFANGVESVELPDVDAVKVSSFKAGVDAVMDDMDWFLERLEDKDVIDDAEDIFAEVKAEDAAIQGAFDFMEEEEDDFFDVLEEEGLVEDEDEVSVIRVYDDFEDVNIIRSDFDDEEYKFELRYKILDEDKEVKKYVLATVKVEDGEYELKKVVEE